MAHQSGVYLHSQRQQQRLRQVIWVCFLSVACGALLSGPRSAVWLTLVAALMLPVFLWLKSDAYEKANSWLLWTLTIAISGLLLLNKGIHDPLIICYPMILMFAALFAGPRLYLSLVVFMLLFCCSLATVDWWQQNLTAIGPVRWQTIITLAMLFAVCGFAVRMVAQDFRTLLNELSDENQRVQESHQTILHLAQTDRLTGLAQRDFARQRFEQWHQQKVDLAIVLLDLDQFKPVNDSLGHSVGDQVLAAVAGRLRQLLQPDEIACRFGGDEFVLVLCTVDESALFGRLDNLLSSLQQPILVEEYSIQLSASVGVAFSSATQHDFNQLCRMADQAMYKAKDAGRNTYLLYKQEWQQHQTDTLKLITDLRQAVREQQLELHYQPKYELSSGRLNGVEALLRWRHPELGWVGPQHFIPLAEETGLIDSLGLWVIRQACLQAVQWHQAGQSLVVAVNLSARQFRSGQLPEQVAAVLAETGLPAELLELELTESMLMDEQYQVQQQLTQLMATGVKLAIDDFGTGYSNLHYLSKFQAATLKIDQSFILQLNSSIRDQALVSGMIQLAHSLGLVVVAEGVELPEVASLLSQMQCDSAQGYLWSKPVTAEQLWQLLTPELIEKHS
ncbi:putative bifunctional diguanylate cyclase/phosphodiesterase [Rheinheimera sp.]|uniref:putative bifunctional diguanylate cyclase/phosphodiesterase n=1 Tax=Rheinheimera sp. TaxID=1869214 RepID=UPI003AF503E8